jgi:TfoX/Sxy family transcriptional regulator of competence genes
MSYSTTLEDKIEDIVHEWDDLEKKKMFGGICYLINGNMCFGIWKDYLVVRMGTDQAAEKLKHDHVREFDITGKSMKGWVMVAKSSWTKRNELAGWLDIGKSFALSLPKKSPKRKSLEEIYYRSRR